MLFPKIQMIKIFLLLLYIHLLNKKDKRHIIILIKKHSIFFIPSVLTNFTFHLLIN